MLTLSTVSDNLQRLSTFASFPTSTMFSSHFSSAGFSYFGKSDIVRCTSCNLEVGNWDGQKTPLEVHLQNSPSCPLVKTLGLKMDAVKSKPGFECSEDNSHGSGNFYSKIKSTEEFQHVSKESKEKSVNHDTLTHSSESVTDGPNSGSSFESGSLNNQSFSGVPSSSMIPHSRPRYLQYCTMQERLSTYSKWPQHIPQSSEDLARAGFFYSGVNDLVRCFQCGGGLTSWQSEDNPWVEHAHWFPECVFLRQNKGNEFVQIVQNMVEQLENQSENPQSNGSDALSSNANNTGIAQACCSDTSDIEQLISVRSVKEMGYSIDVIKPAYMETIKRHKTSNISAVQLLEMVFEIEERKQTTTEATHIDPQMTASSGTDDLNNASGVTNTPDSQPPCIQYETETEICKELSDYQRNKDALLCKVCMEEQVSIVFLPCGHLSTCGQCAPAMRKCPICREYVKGSVKTYLS